MYDHISDWSDSLSVTVSYPASAQADEQTVTEFALLQNYPNPFNPVTRIRYDLPTAAQASLKIYDIRGVCVRTLIDSWKPAGQHTTEWDGRDQQGNRVSSGVYFYRLVIAGERLAKKMLLVE